MDRYTEALARYPEAKISYVGHSNGTYLLAKALELYPCCRFNNVVFAGSVVRREYNWQTLLETNRVNAVLNFVASRDWVVAFIPKLFQLLRWSDLGSAGHDGFGSKKRSDHKFELKEDSKGVYQAIFVRGGHGAGIREPVWELIADFVLNGSVRTDNFPLEIAEGKQARWIDYPSRLIDLLWLATAVGVFFAGRYLYLAVATISDPSLAYVVGFSTALFLMVLWLIVTRI